MVCEHHCYDAFCSVHVNRHIFLYVRKKAVVIMLKTLGATVWNSVAQSSSRSAFVHLWLWCNYTGRLAGTLLCFRFKHSKLLRRQVLSDNRWWEEVTTSCRPIILRRTLIIARGILHTHTTLKYFTNTTLTQLQLCDYQSFTTSQQWITKFKAEHREKICKLCSSYFVFTIPHTGKRLSSSPNNQSGSGSQPAPYSMPTGVHSQQ